VGLIAAALEEKGIQTVCLSNMEEIMGKVVPPRWLALPFPLGYPLGRPNDADLQRRIIRRALQLLEEDGPGPVRQEFSPEADR
jgi:hypothetical protein